MALQRCSKAQCRAQCRAACVCVCTASLDVPGLPTHRRCYLLPLRAVCLDTALYDHEDRQLVRRLVCLTADRLALAGVARPAIERLWHNVQKQTKSVILLLTCSATGSADFRPATAAPRGGLSAQVKRQGPQNGAQACGDDPPGAVSVAYIMGCTIVSAIATANRVCCIAMPALTNCCPRACAHCIAVPPGRQRCTT